MKAQEIICIQCPLGCRGNVMTGGMGEAVTAEGHRCKEGKKYAQAEVAHPVRILTATVIAEGGTDRLLPVRTDRVIPKDKLRACMKALAEVRVRPPVRAGQVIVCNLANTGANIVATTALRACHRPEYYP
jgi:CxxC motif-containing protein